MFDCKSKRKINVIECENTLKYFSHIIDTESNLIVVNNKEYKIYKFFFDCKKRKIISEDKFFNNNFIENNLYFLNPEKFSNKIDFNKLDKNINIVTRNFDLIYFNSRVKLDFKKEHIDYINENIDNYLEKLILIPDSNLNNFDLVFSENNLDLEEHKKKKIYNSKNLNLYIKKNQKNHIFFHKLDINKINFIINYLLPDDNNFFYYYNI